MDTALHDRLIALFEPVLKEIGYELVEVEFVPGQGGGTLRIYIDRFRVTIRSRFRRRDWTEYCAHPGISRSSWNTA